MKYSIVIIKLLVVTKIALLGLQIESTKLLGECDFFLLCSLYEIVQFASFIIFSVTTVIL